MKVMVTGAGALLGQGIIKSLRAAPNRYEIVALDPDPRAVGLHWADQAYLIPFATAPDYLERVSEMMDRERPEAVLIGTDVELMTFAMHKAQLESAYRTCVIVSPPEVIRIADDKWLTYEFLAAHGFPHPRSALPQNLEELLRACDFPLIVKPRTGARSVGVQLVMNERELESAVARVTNPLIQECVATANNEFTSGVVVSAGCVRATVTMRRDLRDGNTYRAYVETGAGFDAVLRAVAERLGGLGPLNFQFRSDHGIPKIFEINARFSGTTPLRAQAGFNEVDAVLQHFVRGQPITPPVLRPVTILRYWSEWVVTPERMMALASC